MRKWMVFLLACLLQLGVMNISWASDDFDEEEGSGEETEEQGYSYVQMGVHFVTNLNYSKKKKYLKCKVELMVSDEETRADILKNMYLLRDEVIMTISEKGYDDLKTTSGKKQLERYMLKKLNARMKENKLGHKIKSVIFPEFIVD